VSDQRSLTHAPRTILLVAGLLLASAIGCRKLRRENKPTDRVVPPLADAATRVDPPSAEGATGPRLTSSGDGWLLTWIEPPTSVGARRVRFSRLLRGVWSAPSTIAEGDRIVANWADVPSVASADGWLLAHWAERVAGGAGAYAYDVRLAWSADGGRTFAALGNANDDATATEHGFVSLVADPAGGFRAVWLDGRETEAQTPHTHVHQVGGAMTLRTRTIRVGTNGTSAIFGPTTLLDARTCDCCSTAAAQTSEGVVVAYRDRDEDDRRDIAIVRSTSEGWTTPRSLHVDGWQVNGCPVNGPAIAAHGRRVVVAWYTYAAARPSIRVAFSDDAGATFAPYVELDGPSGSNAPLGRVGVVLEESGDSILSWMASDRERATVRLRRVARDGRIGEALVVAETGADRDAGVPTIARAGDHLAIAWTEQGKPSHVRVATLPLSSVPHINDAKSAAITSAALAPVRLAVGAKAPEYQATTLDGKPVSLATLRGSPMLLNVWATWCEPCRQEIPVLRSLHERFSAKGLRVVGISVDRETPIAQLRAFVETRRMSYDIWMDRDDRATSAFGLGVLPATILLDRQGHVAWSRSGAITSSEPDLDEAIARVMLP